jgi:hypothetical protein
MTSWASQPTVWVRARTILQQITISPPDHSSTHLKLRFVGLDSYLLVTGCPDRGLNPGGSESFRTHLDQHWGPYSLLHNEYRVLFPGIKRPGRDVKHPPPSSVEVKEKVQLYLWAFMACSRKNFTFYLKTRLEWVEEGPDSLRDHYLLPFRQPCTLTTRSPCLIFVRFHMGAELRNSVATFHFTHNPHLARSPLATDGEQGHFSRYSDHT